MTVDLQTIQRALWSVYCHAFFQAGFSQLLLDKSGHAWVPLRDALATLAATDDDRRRARLVRCLSKLAAADMIRKARFNPFVEPGGDEVYDRIRAITGLLGLNPDFLEAQDPVIAAGIVVAAGETAGCGPYQTTCTCTFDAMTMFTHVVATGVVGRGLNPLKHALDPRNWDNCTTVFRDAHRVRLDATSTDPRHPGYAEDETPPLPGETWLLYEDVIAGAVVIRNILALTFDETVALSIRWNYTLVDNLETSAPGWPVTGKLTDDFGCVEANRLTTGTSSVVVDKTVRWSDETLNLLAPPTLCLWLEDTRGIACC